MYFPSFLAALPTLSHTIMKRLYFDTETTGFPARTAAPLEECPHIVQLAALLIDDTWGEVASMNVIIRPDGWTIPDYVAAIHGITNWHGETFGVTIHSALSLFTQMANQSSQIVAHNISFDMKLMCYEIERLGVESHCGFIATERACTMALTTDLCRLPGKYPGKYKWPKLIEAYRHLFDEDFDGQHDALADVRACARIHQHLIQSETKQLATSGASVHPKGPA